MERKCSYNCFELSPLEYFGLLRVINQSRRESLNESLKGIELDGFLKDEALILTGSDGKEERHPQSETEMIILSEKPIDEASQSLIVAIINDLDQETGKIEIKPLNSSVLSFYNNQEEFIYPDRVLNGFFLLGDQSLFYKARLQVLQEMISDDEVGRKIRETMRSQLKSYRKAIREGKYRNHQIFMIDGDQGQQYYFEGEDWRENIMGFKMGPLRAVQRKLDILTVNGLRAGIFNAEDLALSLPSNTLERFDFFSQRGLLNAEQAKNLSLAYLWFLREYHKAQEEFKRSDRTGVISVPFNLQEFEENMRYINEFFEIKIF
jgi:hypothetical protein